MPQPRSPRAIAQRNGSAEELGFSVNISLLSAIKIGGLYEGRRKERTIFLTMVLSYAV